MEERRGRGGGGECEREGRGSMVGRGGGGEVVLQVVGARGVAPGAKICQEDIIKEAIEVG